MLINGPKNMRIGELLVSLLMTGVLISFFAVFLVIASAYDITKSTWMQIRNRIS